MKKGLIWIGMVLLILLIGLAAFFIGKSSSEEEVLNPVSSQASISSSSVSTASDPSEEISFTSSVDDPDTIQFTAIGDSVMLGAASVLEEEFPNAVIDAKESRQVWHGKELIDELKSENQLFEPVIIALGTNSPFSESSGQEILDDLGPDCTVYWVNAYGIDWQEEVNATIESLAQKNANVHIIDWASTGAKHPEWFYDDGIHLNPDGQEGYAELIAESVL